MMFHESQGDQYLELCINRAKNKYLTWVEQFLDIISENVDINKKHKLNDIGCNLGQFWKGLKRREMNNIDYNGFDFEEIYLKEAKNIFPEVSEKLNMINIANDRPPQCDISVCSATLEHLNYFQPGLDNILKSTNKLVLLRTFMGETSLKSKFKRTGLMSYDIHQFLFHNISYHFQREGFNSQIIQDRRTGSLLQKIENKFPRTFYIVLGVKK